MKHLIRYFYKNIYNYYYGNIRYGRIRPFPSNIFIELTNNCNLKCPICPGQNQPRKKGYMDFGLYRKIIDECAHYPGINIVLHLLGESLLHKDLIKMIKYGKQQGDIKLALSTNATLLNDQYSKELIYSGLDGIHFSIDGLTEETYEKVRVGANFEKTIQKVKRFIELKKTSQRTYPIIEIQIIRMQETQQELQDFVRLWQRESKGTNTIVSVKSYYSWGGLVADQEVKKGIDCRVPCPTIKYLLVIFWNGDVVPCCTDAYGYFKMGNVCDQTILSIWRGERMRQFRSQHIKEEFHKIPFCDGCSGTHRYINFSFVLDVLKRRLFHILGRRMEFLDIEIK